MTEVMYGTGELIQLLLSAPFWMLPVFGLVNLVVTALIYRR